MSIFVSVCLTSLTCVPKVWGLGPSYRNYTVFGVPIVSNEFIQLCQIQFKSYLNYMISDPLVTLFDRTVLHSNEHPCFLDNQDVQVLFSTWKGNSDQEKDTDTYTQNFTKNKTLLCQDLFMYLYVECLTIFCLWSYIYGGSCSLSSDDHEMFGGICILVMGQKKKLLMWIYTQEFVTFESKLTKLVTGKIYRCGGFVCRNLLYLNQS